MPVIARRAVKQRSSASGSSGPRGLSSRRRYSTCVDQHHHHAHRTSHPPPPTPTSTPAPALPPTNQTKTLTPSGILKQRGEAGGGGGAGEAGAGLDARTAKQALQTTGMGKRKACIASGGLIWVGGVRLFWDRNEAVSVRLIREALYFVACFFVGFWLWLWLLASLCRRTIGSRWPAPPPPVVFPCMRLAAAATANYFTTTIQLVRM
ncbi:hypothetical protein C8F04DRAFT_1305456 [Mycena alexandri]|uniref:Uncharacterized protein n=1 Tax=Mycena alexandri TaxID=1745969 RepID=A0AAD6TBG8_9AGAR|nr:hypothetical protein C8F04DRAFT_1305456 [Mycena alexandri]